SIGAIPGINDFAAELLYQAGFKSAEEVSESDLEEILEVEGISKEKAESLHNRRGSLWRKNAAKRKKKKFWPSSRPKRPLRQRRRCRTALHPKTVSLATRQQRQKNRNE